MLEKTLQTTKGTLRIKIPSRLNEVTLGQMIELQENSNLNDLQAISILSGAPVAELKDVRNFDDLSVFADCIFSLSDQIRYLYNSDVVPKKMTFAVDKRNVNVKVPSNLAIEPAGAFMAAREIIADEIKEHVLQYGEDGLKQGFNPSLKSCCQVLAHYFFCRVTGQKYNEYEAEEFCYTIKKLRVTEALPIAKHFFTCYPSLSTPKTSCFHQFQLYWKKKLGFTPSRNLNI